MTTIKYQRQSTISGAFVKGSDLAGIKKAILISEATTQPSQFLDKNGNAKTQDIAKVRFEGLDEVYNISLNKATLNGLIEAFGDDSKDWVEQPLSVETEKMRVGGVARVGIYLIPQGFEKIDNADGFAEIVKKGLEKRLNQPEDDIPVIDDSEEGDSMPEDNG